MWFNLLATNSTWIFAFFFSLQYLEARFDRRLRMFGAFMFTIMNVSVRKWCFFACGSVGAINWIQLFQIGYLPIVVYVPALAFNQGFSSEHTLVRSRSWSNSFFFIQFGIFSVTGVNIHIITPIVCVICVFYTCAVSLSIQISLQSNTICPY